MKKHGIKNRALRIFVSLLLAAFMVISTAPSNIDASSANSNVTEAQKGVYQILLLYRNDNNSYDYVSWGSAFLINSNTIVTCAHCVNLTDAELQIIADAYGKPIAEVKDRLSYAVTISRDVTIPASLYQISVEMDWAVLTLSQSIQGGTPLALRTSEVQQTESVYAIGFPMESHVMQDINTYTSSDSTITAGVVNKVTIGENLYSHQNTEYVQTSCKMVSGNSGGPMVDADGNVIGICEGSTGEGTDADDYYYAISIGQVTTVLDSLGVAYTSAEAPTPEPAPEDSTLENSTLEDSTPEPTPEPAPTVDKTELESLITTAQEKKAEDFDETTFNDMTAALDEAIAVADNTSATADEVAAAQSKLDDAIKALKEAESGMSSGTLIAIIAAAVVVLLVVIILIVVMSGKKKKKNGNNPNGSSTIPVQNYPGQPPHQVPPMQGRPMQSGQPPVQQPGFRPVQPTAAPVPPTGGTGETTVLNQGAGETTVLSKKVNGGTLVRKNGGERIAINAEEFIIGRERTRVNYCVSNNSSVGRVHAKLVVRGSQVFLVDMKATNGTFLNDVRCTPMMEMPIKNGDKITLSDEEFTYQA